MINYSWWLIRTPPIFIYSGVGPTPPGEGDFLLLNSSFFLLLDGTRFKLL
jgi:hypothetical protein